MIDLSDRTAIVTGGAMGIGEAIARRFREAGATVWIADVDEDAGRRVANDIGDNAIFKSCDVSAESEVRDLVEAARAATGRIDIMVNNAGVGTGYDMVEAVEETAMDRAYAINQKGVLFGMKHAVAAMRGSGGTIVNISSIAALSGGTSGLIYTGTKGAVSAMTRSAALHAGGYGIRVNAIAPGIILTPIYEANYPPGVARKVLTHQAESQQPLARLGVPADVANAALWLASDLSDFVTGQTIAVDGGYSSSHRGALEAGFAKLQAELSELEGAQDDG